jgi:hypothetical protein
MWSDSIPGGIMVSTRLNDYIQSESCLSCRYDTWASSSLFINLYMLATPSHVWIRITLNRQHLKSNRIFCCLLVSQFGTVCSTTSSVHSCNTSTPNTPLWSSIGMCTWPNHQCTHKWEAGKNNRTVLESISALWYETCMSSSLCFMLRNMLHIFPSLSIAGKFE